MTEQLFIENSYTDSYKLQNPISINLDIPAENPSIQPWYKKHQQLIITSICVLMWIGIFIFFIYIRPN